MAVVAIAEDNMSTKGRGKGTPSYKQVVLDRGKGPRGIVFKAPMTGTSGSDPEKGQKSNQGKSECMGEDARETQSEAQDTATLNRTKGHNPCKPKTTMIPKVILEDRKCNSTATR